MIFKIIYLLSVVNKEPQFVIAAPAPGGNLISAPRLRLRNTASSNSETWYLYLLVLGHFSHHLFFLHVIQSLALVDQ